MFEAHGVRRANYQVTRVVIQPNLLGHKEAIEPHPDCCRVVSGGVQRRNQSDESRTGRSFR